MSALSITRTLCCKLRVHPDDAGALRTTQAAFNAAASFCATIAWDQGITNTNTLHHQVYRETRARFGLGAQLACCARIKAFEAVTAGRIRGSATIPTFRPTSSIRYDARSFSLRPHDRVSLNTLQGHITAELVLGAYQRHYLADRAWTVDGAELLCRNGIWYLHLT